MSVPVTMWSPGASRSVTQRVAAIPEAKAKAREEEARAAAEAAKKMEEEARKRAEAKPAPAEDLIATDQRFPDRTGEIYQLARGDGHRWYYASEMTPDEVILIKGWDSLDDGRTRFNAHGAFELDDTDETTPPRESIELRTLVIIE